MDKTAEMNVLGKYASYEDLARLEYGRILWANPDSRRRLIRHWTSPSHPHHERFAEHRALVEEVLSPKLDDDSLNKALQARGHSLRTVVREIPPVIGDF